MNNYYVYTYSYPNGVPFYVGIGTGRRAEYHLTSARSNRKDCNKYKQNVIQKILCEGQEPIITKIVENIDREFAVLIEQEFVSKHGRRDNGTGILTNMTDGGEGTNKLNEETEQRRRAAIKAANCSTRFQKGNDSSKAVAARAAKRLPKVVADKTVRGPHTEASKLKMSIAKLNSSLPPNKKGKTLSGNALNNVVEANRISWTCPHCGKDGMGKGAKNRWHFDNCKNKDQK